MQTPIYQKIKLEMCEEIANLPANSSIASERDLALKYDVSRMTVRKAINELVEEGYLYRNKNKGTFVADSVLRKKNTSAITFLKQDKNIEYEIINFDIKATSWNKSLDASKKLAINIEDSIVQIVRLVLLNNRPQSVEEIYIAKKDVPEKDLANFRRLLDLDYYIDQGSITQTFIPMLIPIQYAKLLKLKMGIPIILIENLIRAKSGNPLIYIKSYNNPKEKIIEITT